MKISGRNSNSTSGKVACRILNFNLVWFIIGEKEEITKTRIRELLGDCEGSIGKGWKVTWKNNKGSTKTNWKGVVEEISPPEDIVQKHTQIVTGARVLRVTVKS